MVADDGCVRRAHTCRFIDIWLLFWHEAENEEVVDGIDNALEEVHIEHVLWSNFNDKILARDNLRWLLNDRWSTLIAKTTIDDVDLEAIPLEPLVLQVD